MGGANELSAREAMGLPRGFTDAAVGSDASAARRLRRLSVYALAELVENAGETLTARLAAGRLLGVLGDPRIATLAPRMIEIEGGRFVAGTRFEDVGVVLREWSNVSLKREWILKECPPFEASVRPFRLAKYLITNQEYREFLAATGLPEDIPSSWRFGVYDPSSSNTPVWGIRQQSALRYADWIASLTSRRFRLPSELEWEFAASAAGVREYPWGDTFDRERANTRELGMLRATPVGTFPQGDSIHGICDMGGNVEEFTSDSYTPYPSGEIVRDDLWLMDSSYAMTRGGSFTRFGDLARCRRRHGYYPRDFYAIGFRLAEDA
jgi:formylglycine-generating enzyme required for sulfatase activity